MCMCVCFFNKDNNNNNNESPHHVAFPISSTRNTTTLLYAHEKEIPLCKRKEKTRSYQKVMAHNNEREG